MFELFVDICKKVIDLIKENDKETKENRLMISNVLNDISNLLTDTAEKLKNDIFPHTNCAIMEHLSYELSSKLIKYMDENQIKELNECLNEVVFLEKQFVKRKDPNTIPSIEEAAGKLKSMSILIKI